MEKLKKEQAALSTDVFMTIGCRPGRPPVMTDCADPVLEEPTFLSTRTALTCFLREHRETSFVLRTTLPGGTPVPWQQADSAPQLPLSVLGPVLLAGPGIQDVREVFPTTEQ